MATINNTTDREFVVHGLGVLKPGINKFTIAQVEVFEQLTDRKLSDLKSPTLEVKTASTKKEDN